MAERYTQENRFLSIGTPLGEDKLLLRSFSGHEGISQLFNFELDFVSEDNNINFDDIVGRNVTFGMRLADNETFRYINGYVSRFAQLPGEARFARYQAEVVPWLWFLTRSADCVIYQNQTVPEIIRKVFEKFGFSDFRLELRRSYEPWEYCVQYRETAFNFVSRLMEQEGIFYFFNHENGKHTLVMADSSSAHKPCPDQPRVRFQHSGGPGLAGDEDAIDSWRLEHELRPGKYAVNDFNFETPKLNLLSAIDGTVRQGGNQKYEVYDYPGEYEKRDEGDAWVRLRMEEEEAPHAVISGSSDCRAFTAGFKFELSEHNRRDQNGAYILTTVAHTAHEGASYSGIVGTAVNYSNVFTCIPSSVAFRPPRLVPRPLMQGCQTAFVVGPSGEEIYVDRYGRVKVQFHWDRDGKYNEDSSCWVRVSQNWAGKRWGAVFIPRIGQEVIVDFLEGDPDRPIITGRVYNNDAMPPYVLPDEKTKSAIKSYSSKGGGGFNEIRFEDKKGSEQLFIHAEKNEDIRIKSDKMEWVGNDSHLVIKHDQLEQVEGDKHLSVRGDHNEKVDGSVSLKAGLDMQEKVGSKYALDAGTEIHLKAGMNVVVEAGTTLTLKVGSNFININPGGVFVSGTMVMLNSGGAAGSGSGSSPEPPQAPKEADVAEPGQAVELPPAKPPRPAVVYSPAAVMLRQAAETGAPFCDAST